MENRTKKLKNITLASLMAFSMILSATLLMPALTGEETNDETKLWGRVLDCESEKPIEGAIITITNLQTGEQFILTQNNYKFELFDEVGYFSLQASCEGYFDTGDGYAETLVLKDEIVKMILNLEQVEKDSVISGNVGFLDGENVTGITNATVDLFCIEGDFEGYEDTTLTDNGSYDFDVYDGLYLLLVRNDGNLTQTRKVFVDGADVVENFTMIDGVSDVEIYGYVQDSYNANMVEGLEIVLTDVTNDYEINASFDADYFLFSSLYYSTFDLLVDAVGYKPYLREGIELNESNDLNPMLIDLVKDDEEISHVTYTFNGNLSSMEVLNDRFLNSDSIITGIGDGPGNIKMKLDSMYGNNDGFVNDSEVYNFRTLMENIGPFYLYSDEYFMVNDTIFGAGDVMNYSVVLYNFNGSVDNDTGMRMKTSMIYTIEDDKVVLGSDTHAVWLGDLSDDYTVKFDDQFEIVSFQNDDWEYVLAGDDNVPSQAVVYNETMLVISKKEVPLMNLSAIVNGVNYYPGDDIFVGSATDNTVARDDYENITFDASGSVDSVGKIVNYTWDFGDGEMGYGESVTHNYSVAQGSTETFEVTLLLTDSAGETNGDFATNKLLVTVDASAPTVVNTATLIETLQGNWTQFNKIVFNASTFEDDVELPDAAGNYIWEFEDGTENFGKTTEHVFGVAGEAIVNLTVKDLIGNMKKVSLTLNLLDTEDPVVEILGNLSVKVKETLSLNGSLCFDNQDEVEDLVFRWDFNDTEVNARTNRTGIFATPVYDVPGTYVVVLNVTDSSGNVGETTKTITVTAADITISSMDVSDTKPSEGEEIDVNVLVSNKGTVAADGFTVALYVDGKEFTSMFISYLDIGGKQAVNFTWVAEAGEHEVQVKVDSNTVIIEENENNNQQMILVEGAESSSWTAMIVVVLLIIVAIVVFLVIKKKRDL